MTSERQGSRSVARLAGAVPGVLLVMSFADDALAGPLIAAVALTWQPWGDLVVVGVFTALSLGAALLTRWGMRSVTGRASDRLTARLDRVRSGRVGRRVLGWIGDGRPWGSAAAAVGLGCVAPIILIELGHPAGASRSTALVCGVAYGLAFAVTYGAAGRLLDLIS